MVNSDSSSGSVDGTSSRNGDSSSGDDDTNEKNAAAAMTITRRTSMLANMKRSHTNIDVRKSSEIPHIVPVNYASFLCGLSSGVLQAGIFNPFDRALYLSITNNTPLLTLTNFRNPYQGFFQSIGGKALSGGLYFPVEQCFLEKLQRQHHGEQHDNTKNQNDPIRNLLAGMGAGSVNAIIMNPLNAIRYKTWGRMDGDRGFLKEATTMLRKGSAMTKQKKKKTMVASSSASASATILSHPFLKGIIPTLFRDVTFGSCYTFMRLQIQYHMDIDPTSNHQFFVNLCSAAIATILSSPLNFARNIQYASKSGEVQPSTKQILYTLYQEMNQHSSSSSTLRKCQFLVVRLRIGWGTARGSMGMAFGHWAYEQLHGLFIMDTTNTDDPFLE